MIPKLLTRFSGILPLATAAFLFLALIFFTTQYRSRLDHAWKQRDEARQALRDQGALESRLFSPGDTFPRVTLVNSAGRRTTLRDLPQQFKYLYFERQNCPPCQILAQIWPRTPKAKLDSIAFIEFDTLINLSPVSRLNHFAWVHDTSDSRRYVHFIPSAVVRGEGDRVLTAAHGSLPKVATLFDMFGILSRAEVDELVAAARAGRAKTLARADSSESGK